MTQPINPEAFAPGDYIREEIEARGWSQLDLAEILGRPPQAVNELIAGKRSITTDMAKDLADAFGTSAQLWMNLDSAYQLVRQSVERNDAVARKAKLWAIAPVKDMQKRGWIESSSSIDVLESEVLKFYGISSLDEAIYLDHAARKSTDYSKLTPPQLAWLIRVRNLAQAVPVAARFTPKLFDGALSELRKLRAEPEETRHIPRLLSEAGVRFLIVAPMPHTKIDGVTLWLSDDEPVVALSFRYDRIDWFWHTLMHEMGHVKNGEGKQNPTVDMQLVGNDAQQADEKPESERAADRFASSFLVDPNELDKFIARVHPLYSKLKISTFAKRLLVHPGIVVGQLQFRKKIQYAHSREFLIAVKRIIAPAALTDGWGESVWI